MAISKEFFRTRVKIFKIKLLLYFMVPNIKKKKM